MVHFISFDSMNHFLEPSNNIVEMNDINSHNQTAFSHKLPEECYKSNVFALEIVYILHNFVILQ